MAVSLAWRLAATPPNAAIRPGDLSDALDWLAADIPGTVASALRAAGRFDEPEPLHDRDWWLHATVHGHGAYRLRLNGLATIAEVFVNGVEVLRSENMFRAHDLPIRLAGTAELHICCRSLSAWLAARRGRGRWRPSLMQPTSLRHARTTLLGHMNGWCPPLHAVGAWRGVDVIAEADPASVVPTVRVSYSSGHGRVRVGLTWAAGMPDEGWFQVGDHRAPLRRVAPDRLDGEVTVTEPRLWWPHTHGEPALYPVSAGLVGATLDLGLTGFRRLHLDRGSDGRGFALHVNGVPIFCRGAVWIPPDLASLSDAETDLRPALMQARVAGMNMLRVSGTTVYGGDTFYRLCDEFGIMVWQDFMFANLDYPSDAAFADTCRAEAVDFLTRTSRSPSLVTLCGGSEVAQQAAMLGLPKSAWTGALFATVLADACAQGRDDVPYITNTPLAAPDSDEMPFRPDEAVAHYFGVGAYERPVADARSARVRFTAECLAFAHVPDELTVESMGVAAVHHPSWKRAVPRDAGASWDFEDTRDHYLARLYGVDARTLRREDPERYLDLSRAVTVDIVTDVIAEWRREGSGCGGALVWTLRDLVPGAGWGVVDAFGRPKPVWYALARAFRPQHITLTDEGLNGLAIHVVNDRDCELRASVVMTCLRDGDVRVAAARAEIGVPPRGSVCLSANTMLGRFLDLTYAYRFGPIPVDVTHAALHDADSDVLISETFHFPGDRLWPRAQLDLRAEVARDDDGWWLMLATDQVARHVGIRADGFAPDDNWFHLSPTSPRRIGLRAAGTGGPTPRGEIRATNMRHPARFGAAA